MMKGKFSRIQAFSSSRMPKTGHSVFLVPRKDVTMGRTPVCPIHAKPAIIREPYDEIWVTRWYCIDCIAYALYPSNIPFYVKDAQEERKQ